MFPNILFLHCENSTTTKLQTFLKITTMTQKIFVYTIQELVNGQWRNIMQFRNREQCAKVLCKLIMNTSGYYNLLTKEIQFQ